jgi:hypothetical protein
LPAFYSRSLSKDRTKDMPENASRRGAVDMGMPLMILAFIVMGGFVWWLKGQSDAEMEARRIAEAEAIAEQAARDSAEAAARASTDINALIQPGVDMTEYEGQRIRGADYEVASQLGTQGFWVNTEYGNPFLIIYPDEMLADGTSVSPGDRVNVTGELMPMDPAVLDEWTAAGTITANDRVIAEFATHYVVADQVTVTASAGA